MTGKTCLSFWRFHRNEKNVAGAYKLSNYRNDGENLSCLFVSLHRNDRKNVLKRGSKFDLTGIVGICMLASVHKRRKICNISFSTIDRACNT